MSDVQIKRMADLRQLPESIDIRRASGRFIVGSEHFAWTAFDHEMEFYRLADLSRVWVVAEIY